MEHPWHLKKEKTISYNENKGTNKKNSMFTLVLSYNSHKHRNQRTVSKLHFFFFFLFGQYRWPQLNNLSIELRLSSQLLTSKRNERTEITGLLTLQSEWLTAKSKGNCSLQIVSNKSYLIQNFKVLGPLVNLTVMNKETEI